MTGSTPDRGSSQRTAQNKALTAALSVYVQVRAVKGLGADRFVRVLCAGRELYSGAAGERLPQSVTLAGKPVKSARTVLWWDRSGQSPCPQGTQRPEVAASSFPMQLPC